MSIQIPGSLFFCWFEIVKLILKFIWKSKRLRIDKRTLKKKSKVGGVTLPDVKKKKKESYSNQDGVAWHRDKHTDHWIRTDSPEINPYVNR